MADDAKAAVDDFFGGLEPTASPQSLSSTPAQAAPGVSQLQASDTNAAPVVTPMNLPDGAAAAPEAPPTFQPIPIPEAALKVPELKQEQIKPVDYSDRDRAFQEHLENLRHPLAKLPEVSKPAEAPKQSMLDMISKPTGAFLKGILAGDIDVADSIRALAQSPTKMGTEAGSKPIKDAGQKFEENFASDIANDPAYKAGKFAGQMGTYGATSIAAGAAAAAAGLPAAGAGLLGLGAAGLEGAAQGAGSNAREQMRKTGRISDASGFALDAGLGAGLGVGGGMAGNALQAAARPLIRKAGKFLSKRSLDAAMKEAGAMRDKSLAAIENNEYALKGIVEESSEVVDKIKDEVLKHEVEAMDKLAKMFEQPPAENMLQQAQREAMAAPAKTATKALTKPIIQRFNYGNSGRFTNVHFDNATEANLVVYASRTKKAEIGNNPRPFPEAPAMREALAKELGVEPDEIFGIASKYAREVKAGAEKASHVAEDFKAPSVHGSVLPAKENKAPFRLRKRSIGYQTIEHAMPLADAAQHMSDDLFERFSEAVQALGEAKAVMSHFKNEVEATAQNGLRLAKTKAQKAMIEVEESTRLNSAAAADLAKEKSRLYTKQRLEEIAQMDDALQRAKMPHNILDEIPMSKYLYGIADRTGFFKTPRHLADDFTEAYKEFVSAASDLKAAKKQYEKLSEHFLPTFEEAEHAYQGSVGTDQQRLWVKTRITNPFSISKEPPLITDAKQLAARVVHEDKNFPLSNQQFREGGKSDGYSFTPKDLTDEQLQQAVDTINYRRKNKSTKHGDVKQLDAFVQELMRREQRKAAGFPKDWKQAEAAKFEGLSDEDLGHIMDTGSEASANEAALEMLRRANPDEDMSKYSVRTTDFAIGLQHNPYVAKLNEMYAKELKIFDAELRAQGENLVTEVAYKVGGVEKLAKQSGKDAMERLRELGVLHPIAKSLALAAAFGITALDAPAEASNGSPVEQKHFFGTLGLTAAAAILAGKYGVPAAMKIIRTPSWVYTRAFANTRDLAGFADAAMGISAAANKGSSMVHNMQALAGKVIQAVVDSPDDHVYLLKAVHGDVDLKLLSPKGRQFVKEIRDESKAFKDFVGGYAREWNKAYRTMPAAQQAELEPVHAAIDFISNNFGNAPRMKNGIDRAASYLFGNAARAWFTLNPKIWMASIGDLAISGPLQVGPMAMARSAKTLAVNPVIRGLVDKMELGGARSQALNALNNSGSALSAEAMQTRTLAVASLSRYFHTNPRTMRHAGISDEETFIRRALTGQIDKDVRADAFIQMSADLADTVGADPLRLTRGPVGRSMLGNYLQFVSQPERYARLMALRVRTNPKWVLASMGATWQFAGHSVLPLSLRMIGYAAAGEATAKLISLIDMTSAGQRLLGPMSNQVDWDPFLYPAMGVQAPGFDSVLEVLGDWPSTSAAIGEVMYQASQGGRGLQRMAGNPQVEANQKAQYALYSLLQKIALALPMTGPIPTRAIANFAYHAPAAMAGVARVSIPNPIHLGKGKPLKPMEVKRFDGAAEQSLRGALGLPDSFKVGLFKTANSVPKSNRSPVMRSIKADSGIY